MQVSDTVIPQVLQCYYRLGKHQAGQSNGQHSPFHQVRIRIHFIVQVSIRSYLKCFNVTTANYPPRKTSSRSAFNFEQVSVTSDPFVSDSTVQRLFSRNLSLIAWNVIKKRCLTVGRRSRDLRPLSRDRSATFFKKISNCLKRPKNVVWQSADGRVTSDHCRVTVQRLFSKNFLIAWNVQKTLFDSRPTVAWPPTTVAWPFSDFFQNFPKLLETSKKRCLTVGRRGRRSRDLRPLSRDRSATFFQNFPKLLETSKKRCLTVGRRSRDLRPLSRDRSATFFKISSLIAWNVSKNVVWQSADGRVTSTTVAWPFSDFFQNFPELLETSKNVFWQSADGRVTSDQCRVTVQRLFSKFSQIA